jgi:acyl-CoA reductase-like NAD-dependent aldehyde dehydrogenase
VRRPAQPKVEEKRRRRAGFVAIDHGVKSLRLIQSEIAFGGYKMSGIGREHGAEAIHEYTQAKSITVGLERFKSRFEV